MLPAVAAGRGRESGAKAPHSKEQVEVLIAPSQARLAAALQHRFFLRLHMTAILTGTLLVGLLATRILFILHLNIFAIRYPLAVMAAYAAFVGFVKLWILYIAWCGTRRGRDDWFDCLNFSGSGTSPWDGGRSITAPERCV